MDIRKIDYKLTYPIRHQVMWPEKSLEYIKLECDEEGIHFGLYVKEELVSVISVFINSNEAQFRKFATLQKHQGNGLGSILLEYTIDYLKKNNVKKVWCNARVEKTEFYKRFGLIETNETFEKGNKKYVIMDKKL